MKKQALTKKSMKLNRLTHDERKARAAKKARLHAERLTAAKRAEREAAIAEALAAVPRLAAARPAVVLDLVTGGPEFTENTLLTAFRRGVVIKAQWDSDRAAEVAAIERLTKPGREAGKVCLANAFARVGL